MKRWRCWSANAASWKTSHDAPVGSTSTSSLLSSTSVAAVDVPKPPDWALMLTGLLFVVGMTRMNGRANTRRLGAAPATVARVIA